MVSKKFLLMIICGMAILLMISCGCTSSQTTSQSSTQPTPKAKLATLEPRDMALQESDFPQGFTVSERGERLQSDITIGKKFGYIKGYNLIIKRAPSLTDFTTVTQTISIYPIENMSAVIASASGESINSLRYEEMSNPNIGDMSIAFRRLNSITNRHDYLILFTKYNVYEQLHMTGTSTDSELLLDLAKKAADRIHN